MNELYGNDCPHCGGFRDEESVDIVFDADVLARMLREIYGGLDVRDAVQRDAFEETLRLFNLATAEGLSQAAYQDYDDLFLEQLRTNNEVFSAFRVHRMQNDMAARLLDKDGRLKPFDRWAEDVRDISSHYAVSWLRTEYATAVIRARQAAEWKGFRAEADVLPNLRWMPTTSPEPDNLHRQYWQARLTLPVGHPFWEQHRPGDRWNCKCSLRQTGEPTTAEAVAGFQPVPPAPGLDGNPADDGRLFSGSHPYFTKAHPGAGKAAADIIQVEEADRRFQPVKSVGEAKLKAGKYGVKEFDTGDASIEEVNAVLQVLHDEAAHIPVDLNAIQLRRGLKSTNHTKEVGGYYLESERKIAINLKGFNENIYRPPVPFEEQLERFGKRLGSLRKQLEDIQQRIKKAGKANKLLKEEEKRLKGSISDIEYKVGKIRQDMAKGKHALPDTVSATFKDIRRQVQCEIHHEFGHYVYHRLGEPSFRNFDIEASKYGATASNENFAEWYAHYRMRGAAGVPDNLLRLFREAERNVAEDARHYTVIPTQRGKLRIHDGHGKNERDENIRVGKYLAEKHGYDIDLQDNPQNKPSADSYNRTLGVFQEYKVNSTPTISSINNLLRKAKDQANDIVLWIDSDISWEDLMSALRSRVRRTDSINTVTIVRDGKDITVSREDVLKDGFKIRPADLT